MKHKALLFFSICTLLLIASCTNWRETAGEIAGMWQMTEWRNADGQTLATKDKGIYYCIQLDLMKFQRKDKDDYYLSYYTHTRDSLIIGKIVHWPSDSVCTFSALESFGVPADGRFHVDVLNDDHLQLSSKEATLVFRRY